MSQGMPLCVSLINVHTVPSKLMLAAMSSIKKLNI